jgi:hypothetical protein
MRWLRIVLAVAAVALAHPAAGSAETAACTPPDGLSSRTIVNGTTAGGAPETTERLGGSAYEVHTCDQAGRFVASRRVELLRTPAADWTPLVTQRTVPRPGGVLMTTDIDYAADPEPPTWPPETELGPADPCASSAFELQRSKWVAPSPGAVPSYGWYARLDTFPGGAATLEAVVAGHEAWDATVNDCGLADQRNVESTYLGETTASYSATCDGVSVVDFGSLQEVGIEPDTVVDVLAVTSSCRLPSGVRTETDQRYDASEAWSTTGDPCCFDLQSVATHESGHSIGLGHVTVPGSERLTMTPDVGPGTIELRTLGLGDVLGMRALYPPVVEAPPALILER